MTFTQQPHSNSSNERPAADVRTVSQRFRLALPLYLCLLLALALVGALNQRLLAEQLALMDAKADLLVEVAAVRVSAAAVDGPEAVSAWAEANGLVSVPEASAARLVAPLPAPSEPSNDPSMELRTVWR